MTVAEKIVAETAPFQMIHQTALENAEVEEKSSKKSSKKEKKAKKEKKKEPVRKLSAEDIGVAVENADSDADGQKKEKKEKKSKEGEEKKEKKR